MHCGFRQCKGKECSSVFFVCYTYLQQLFLQKLNQQFTERLALIERICVFTITAGYPVLFGETAGFSGEYIRFNHADHWGIRLLHSVAHCRYVPPLHGSPGRVL